MYITCGNLSINKQFELNWTETDLVLSIIKLNLTGLTFLLRPMNKALLITEQWWFVLIRRVKKDFFPSKVVGVVMWLVPAHSLWLNWNPQTGFHGIKPPFQAPMEGHSCSQLYFHMGIRWLWRLFFGDFLGLNF